MKKEISGELSIRMDCSGNVYVDNLTEKNITNFEEGMQLVEQGQSRIYIFWFLIFPRYNVSFSKR